jgi:hypothetical protein
LNIDQFLADEVLGHNHAFAPLAYTVVLPTVNGSTRRA